MNSIWVLTRILWFFSFVFVLYAVYYTVIAVFAFKKSKVYEQSDNKNRFAIIIPARNEGRVVGKLVKSLKEQDYPPELFEIFVIPNNCTDNTAEAAREAGASILECTEAVRSKGHVLDFAMGHLLERTDSFDAFCIFDADNLVDANFLKEMNKAINSGAMVAQGYRDSKNPGDSAVSACHSIYYYYVNGLYNRARSVLGLSAVITGTGFMVSAEIIRQFGGWKTRTMTEDLEFSALCVLKGLKIHWVPDAVIYDEQPVSIRQSWNQRIRWSTGNQQCFLAYFRPLALNAVKRRDMDSLDLIFLFMASYMQILGFASMLVTLGLILFNVHFRLFPQTDIFFKLFMSLDGSYLSSTVIALVAVALERKSIHKMLRGILASWFFIISWIPINIVCLFKKSNVWKQIEHTRELSLSDI